MFGKGTQTGNLEGTSKNANPETLQNLAKSGEVQQLMSMLKKNGGVQQAAQSASKGNPAELLGMVQQIMSTQEGANLIGTIQKKAKDAGLE